VILSDRSIRKELAAGRIVISPLDEADVQPSSVDLHVDRYFRVFRNHSMRVIDVKEDQEELTELVEVSAEAPLILHPGEFVLGSTLERVGLPDDLVGRLEGKSSLGRLGLLIHSSLPGSELVPLLDYSQLRAVPIEEIVRKQLAGSVVAFDPDTFEVGYFPITGWYEGPADRIFEVRLASGRSVRVTGGHCLFSIDRRRGLIKLRAGELHPGRVLAVPRRIPDPEHSSPEMALRKLASGCGQGSVRAPSLRRLSTASGRCGTLEPSPRLRRLTDGGLGWDRVEEVVDTGTSEPVFDLEVRPGRRRIENFLAGSGGVFVSNTAGFVDPGFDGHLTLELSNVANLPITVYPGMKIGQISFLRMSSAAERPYGTESLGSKYQSQRGPTQSRYFENFRRP
jgi:deoxycytidine triphosphate deaminase